MRLPPIPSLGALLVLGAALLLPAVALADPPDDARDHDRERMHEEMRIVRAAALTEALELDEATATKLFPYLRGFDVRADELHQQKRERRKALRGMVKTEEFDDDLIDEHLQALGEIDVELAQIRAEQLGGLDRILSAEQRVKFLMVQQKLEERVRQVIRRERRERRDHRERDIERRRGE
jgi:Spy/CpxP family protein refolding chaperone